MAAPRAGARLRRRAQEHLLPRQGRARLGRPPHRRPRELRDAELVPRAGSSTSSACSRSSPRSSPTTCTPTTSRPRYALDARGSSAVAVQHHHAHLAACLAEHGERGPGGRARSSTAPATGPTARSGAARSCVGDLAAFERAGLPVPGAPAGRRRRRSREPWRMACAWLAAALERRAPAIPAALARRGRRPRAGRRSASWSRAGVNSPLTTSAGRLFDAVAALCGVRRAGELRGPGGERARGRRRPGGSRRLPADRARPGGRGAADASTRERRSGRWRDDVAGGVAGGDRRRPLPQRRSRPRTAAACAREAERRQRIDLVVALRRRVPEPAAARAHRRRCCAAAACAC